MTEIGDRVRVQTEREAVAMTAETEIVKATKEMTKIEEVQTGATERGKKDNQMIEKNRKRKVESREKTYGKTAQ